MNYVNCTPHPINMNDGTTYPASGIVPRVGVVFGEFVNGVCQQYFGAVEGMPSQADGTMYIVSAMVLSAMAGREDVVAPATGHPECVRNEKGHIVSVPGFVRG